MFNLIEIVGVSKESFSDAVKKTVDQIINSGKKVFWFEVVEQRGAVKEGNAVEFQVKLKVAVNAVFNNKDMVESVSGDQKICPTCDKPVGKGGHMCSPETLNDATCEWCGSQIIDERHLCGDKVSELAYICNSCGRTAVKPENLCDPKRIQ